MSLGSGFPDVGGAVARGRRLRPNSGPGLAGAGVSERRGIRLWPPLTHQRSYAEEWAVELAGPVVPAVPTPGPRARARAQDGPSHQGSPPRTPTLALSTLGERPLSRLPPVRSHVRGVRKEGGMDTSSGVVRLRVNGAVTLPLFYGAFERHFY